MVRSPRSFASSGTPSSRASAGSRDRGVAGAARLLLAAAVVGTLVIGAAVYGPQLGESVDGLDDGSPAGGDREPPSTTDPDADRDLADPGDPGESTYDGQLQTISSSAVEAHVHELVDAERAERDLDPLSRDDTVASVARAHSVDMHEAEFFAHENPDGEAPFDRFRDVDDYCSGYGENIARTWADRQVEGSDGDVGRYSTAEAVAEALVDGWMDSPPHRDAILSDDWDRDGVGVYVTDEGAVYATHNFCQEW